MEGQPWQTGTSAKSWALRRQGRYKEADQMLLDAMKGDGDAEAYFTMYMLSGYQGSLCSTHYSHVDSIILLRAAKYGHPVATSLCCHADDIERHARSVRNHPFALYEILERVPVVMHERMGMPSQEDLIERIVWEDEPESLWRVSKAVHNRDVSDALVERLALHHHHPMAAHQLGREHRNVLEIGKMLGYQDGCAGPSLSDVIFRSVAAFEIAASQGHMDAAYCLASILFDPKVPISVQDANRGARLLVDILVRSNGNPEKHYVGLLHTRLDPDLTRWQPDRAREFYHYGKNWHQLPKADVMFPLDIQKHNERTWVSRWGELPAIDLGPLHPKRVYLEMHKACQHATIILLGLLLRRRHLFPRVPRDIVHKLAHLVWDEREREAGSWWREK